jgi:hypothetical protein
MARCRNEKAAPRQYRATLKELQQILGEKNFYFDDSKTHAEFMSVYVYTDILLLRIEIGKKYSKIIFFEKLCEKKYPGHRRETEFLKFVRARELSNCKEFNEKILAAKDDTVKRFNQVD